MTQNTIPAVALDWVLDALYRQVDQIQEEACALQVIQQ